MGIRISSALMIYREELSDCRKRIKLRVIRYYCHMIEQVYMETPAQSIYSDSEIGSL